MLTFEFQTLAVVPVSDKRLGLLGINHQEGVENLRGLSVTVYDF